jgi:lipooligosaccharide transport system permease protein
MAVASAQRRLHRLEPAALRGMMMREVVNFSSFWRSSTFSSTVDPTIYMLAFGFGFGSLVSTVAGYDYIDFVGTGIVATTVLFAGAFPAMYSTFVKYEFQHTYDAILAAPVDVEELVSAEMLWIGLRASVYGCFPLVVTIFFGLDPAWGMLLVPIFCLVTALGFAGFGIAMAAIVAKIDQFNYVTALFVTPLFLVSGAFFPISELPEGVRIVAQLNPLHQLVELVRGGAFGYEAVDLIRFASLVAFAVVMWRIAVNRMAARLID